MYKNVTLPHPSLAFIWPFHFVKSGIQSIPKIYHKEGLFSKFAYILFKVYWLILQNIKYIYHVVFMLLNFENI
jgi:hypothetical protein